MGRKRVRPLGQISFKLPSERHEELLWVASVFNTDISGILNILLAEHLPGWISKAKDVEKSRDAARSDFEEMTVTLPDPPGAVVKLAADAGRTHPEAGRWDAMVKAIERHVKGMAPVAIANIVYAAGLQIEREQQRREIEDAVDRMARDIDAGLKSGELDGSPF